MSLLIPGSVNFNDSYIRFIEVQELTDGTAILENGTLTGLNLPIEGQDAANKEYVDSEVAGSSTRIPSTWKYTAVAASTTNVSLLTSSPASIDGATLTLNDRVLLKNQNDARENGIYVFTSTSAVLTPSIDAAVGVLASGSTICIYGGTTNAGKFFYIPSITGVAPYTVGFGESISCSQFGITTPAGNTTEVQFNINDFFAASSNFVYNGSSLTLIPSNKLVLNTIQTYNTNPAYLYTNHANSIIFGNTNTTTSVNIMGADGSLSLGVGSVSAYGNIELDGTDTSNDEPGSIIIKSGNYSGTVPTINAGKIILRPQSSTNTDNGYVSIEGTRESTSITNGLLVVSGGIGIGENFNTGGFVNILSTANAISPTTGALIISGGLGISKNLYISPVSTVYIQNSNNSTSSTFGSLLISGGLAVNSTIYTDKATGLTAPSANTDAVNKQYVDSVFRVAAGLNTQVQFNSSGVLSASSNLIYDGTSMIISNNTESSNVTTGSLIIDGGLGLSKNMNINGVVTENNNTDASVLGGGSLIVNGGMSVFKSVIYGTNSTVNMLCTTNSTSITSGALTVAGGISVVQDIWTNIANSNLPIINYGTGIDGSYTVGSANLYLFKDMNYINLTVGGSYILYPLNNRIYCTGTLTNNGTICADGNNGQDGVSGVSSTGGTCAAMTTGQGSGGSVGTFLARGGVPEIAQVCSGMLSGGSGGISSTVSSVGGVPLICSGKPRIVSQDVRETMVCTLQLSSSGGGGGASSGNSVGGGGAAGAGTIWIASRNFNNLGKLSANGGNGGNGYGDPGGNGGGGGGAGSGGLVVLAFDYLLNLGKISMNGGRGGIKGSAAEFVQQATDGTGSTQGYLSYYNARTGVWTDTNADQN